MIGRAFTALFVALAGCDNEERPVDQDRDGYPSDVDCDDSRADVHPNNEESCDGRDNDCDDEIDEGTKQEFYLDSDEDGYPDESQSETICAGEEPSDQYIAPRNDGLFDCDDSVALVNPDATEICDEVDNNCDGQINEGVGNPYYLDDDGDGWGAGNVLYFCDDPGSLYSTRDGDCNDGHANFYPGAPETCDDTEDFNCDGATGLDDNDNDGFAACDDCNDNDFDINPGVDEVCGDAIDNNCDGAIDVGAIDAPRWWEDFDNDSYGDPESFVDGFCAQPTGYVNNADDCDDDDVALNPDTPWYEDFDSDNYGNQASVLEQCEQPDGYVANFDDCDDGNASINPDTVWYEDFDEDLYGNASSTLQQCEQPSGYVTNAEDCDDEDSTLNPATFWYEDFDGDDYGDAESVLQQCEQPDGFVANGDDCDDTTATLNPDTAWFADADNDDYGNPSAVRLQCEQPSGFVANDQDCNDGNPAINPETVWFADGDSDLFGDPSSTTQQCLQPNGYVANADDCDDENDNLNPDTPWYEDFDGDFYGTVDSVQNQCEQPVGFVDNADDCDDNDVTLNPETEWYEDSDTDQYGNPSVIQQQCEQPSGFVANDEDCDDDNAQLNPETPWHHDGDNDDYGDPADFVQQCTQPAGYVNDATDCDDDNILINPETVWHFDADNDDYGRALPVLVQCEKPVNYALREGDCDDTDRFINPETPWYEDFDADNYGNPNSFVQQCVQPNGYVRDNNDCNDANAAVNPETVWNIDADEDGYGVTDGQIIGCEQPNMFVLDDADCDDFNPLINPGMTTDPEFDGVAADCSDFEVLDTNTIGFSVVGRSEDLLGIEPDSIQAGGDVNGDGFDDLLIGNPRADVNGANSGEIAILYGGPRGGQPTIAIDSLPRLSGTVANEMLGGSIVPLGDLDGDLKDDFAVGARGTDKIYIVPGANFSGNALVSGAAIATISGVDPYTLSAGHANSDNILDLFVGAPFGCSCVQVYLGPFSGNITSLDVDVQIDLPIVDEGGYSVDARWDFSGDGLSDPIISAIGFSDTSEPRLGGVFVDFSPLFDGDLSTVSEFSVTGDVSNSNIGTFVLGLEDRTNDGWPELLIGGTGINSSGISGAVSYFSSQTVRSVGSTTFSNGLAQYFSGSGEALGLQFAAGDFTGDFISDVCFGAYQNDDFANNAGKVDCINGSAMGTGAMQLNNQIVVTRILGGGAEKRFGQVLEFVDLDDDGHADLVSTMPTNDSNAPGEVKIIYSDHRQD